MKTVTKFMAEKITDKIMKDVAERYTIILKPEELRIDILAELCTLTHDKTSELIKVVNDRIDITEYVKLSKN